jgi:hypothetical protein
MFNGKKDRLLNIFPIPELQQKILTMRRFMETIASSYLTKGNWEGMQEELVKNKAVEIKYNLMFIESKAGRIFSIWANIIAKKKNQTAWLVAFKYYLLIALFIAAPIILLINAIFFKPFLSKRIKEKKQYYLGVN